MDCKKKKKKRERDFRQFLFFWGRDVRHVKVIFFFFFLRKKINTMKILTYGFWFFLVELIKIYIKRIL